MITYTLTPDPKAHQWHITLKFQNPSDSSAVLKLPNWVPGSYLIRDFSRHIITISAECDGQPAALSQTAKNIWQTSPKSGHWVIRYIVYAFDLSVRGSFLDTNRGFFDGSCLFFSIEGRLKDTHSLSFNDLPKEWRIATSMPTTGSNTFQTASYHDLIDHPVELGNIEFLDFEAGGIPHRIALSGHYPDFDRDRLVSDIRTICKTELTMFPSPAPFTHYLFLLHVGDNIYGGLEHISSTALLADRHSLPPHGMTEANDAYTQLLGLFSHEYFHAWNVKSIKPAAFAPYDLDRENYTEQLWAFEGITSYYDDLFLARSRTIAPESYLRLLAQSITRVQQTKGRLKQSLAESSFTAWNKFYKQDENSPNAIVSYYQKGALAALCLNLAIRSKSNGRHTLDSVMQQHYRDWLATRQGIPEKQWQARCQAFTGLDLEDFFQTTLYTTTDLPLAELLATIGIGLQWQAQPRGHGGAFLSEPPTETPAPASDFGARFKQNSDHATLTHVFNGGSAENAALCPQDKIIAIDGYACTDLAAQWAQLPIGTTARLHYFRTGILYVADITVQAAEADTAVLYITDRELFENWLYNDRA
ncbi:M61 family metallopeptidase [Neisseria elongata]|uniref:M61 family metallopeptidase n=1 Tax=Neisseria elongata subsp. nitroreducens TaxID=90367 RepID=A0A9X1CYP1_NEIEL|nr:M61 family metallopeptidase [Neisseria elongata]MBS9340666.1 M61 family metallopeptidase [Neisseria elongata subsp. nitroreducens]